MVIIHPERFKTEKYFMREEGNGVSTIENTKEAKEQYHKAWWGSQDIILTKEQIQALLDGKCLAFNDGEYSHTICLEVTQ